MAQNPNNNNNTDLEHTLNTKKKCEDKQRCSENRAKQCHTRNKKNWVRRHVSRQERHISCILT